MAWLAGWCLLDCRCRSSVIAAGWYFTGGGACCLNVCAPARRESAAHHHHNQQAVYLPACLSAVYPLLSHPPRFILLPPHPFPLTLPLPPTYIALPQALIQLCKRAETAHLCLCVAARRMQQRRAYILIGCLRITQDSPVQSSPLSSLFFLSFLSFSIPYTTPAAPPCSQPRAVGPGKNGDAAEKRSHPSPVARRPTAAKRACFCFFALFCCLGLVN